MYWIIVSCLGVSLIAYIIPLATIQTGARYFAMMLLPSVCSKSLHYLQLEITVLTFSI